MSATGWLQGSDAWLVRDINGNDTIDSGLELFGVDTDITVNNVMRKATNGFEALKALDNGDNVFSAAEASSKKVLLWRDLNQNGVSDAGELSTFADNGIDSIALNYTVTNTDLGGGNSITGKAVVTRSTGTTEIDSVRIGGDSSANNLNLADNPFYRTFPAMALTSVAQALPGMSGSGDVRDLREAMSLTSTQATALVATVTQFKQATTRDAQMALIDQLIQRWGATSIMATSASATTNATGIAAFASSQPDLYKRIIALEQFNGVRALTQWANASTVNIAAPVVALLSNAYVALRDSVYSALVTQTRLAPYLNAVNLVIDDTGVTFDTSAIDSKLNAYKTTDAKNALVDLVELNRFAHATLGSFGFDGMGKLRGWTDGLAANSPLRATLTELNVFLDTSTTGTSARDIYLGDQGANDFSAGDGDDLVAAGDGNDRIYGQADDDFLKGGAGDDKIYGGDDNDTLDGGTENDYLSGGTGADTYLFGKGSGQDIIYNYDDDGVGNHPDTILLGAGIVPADLTVTRLADDLIIAINDSTDTLRVQNYFYTGSATNYTVENIKFADSTIWNVSAVQVKVLVSTPGNDTLYGYSTADTINGGDGHDLVKGGEGADIIKGGADNDTIFGDNGSDILDGDTSNDLLYGGGGADVYLFGLGSGQDSINNYDDDASGIKPDTIRLGARLVGSGIKLSRSGDDLTIEINGANDSLRVLNHFSGDGTSAYAIENIQFSDGLIWNAATIKAKTLVSTNADDTITGFSSDDAIDGSNGGDELHGGSGNDTLNGDAGSDRLYGEAGNDILNGGEGYNQIYGGEGNDRLLGSNGNSVLSGDAGNDTFEAGSGRDTLQGGNGADIYIFGTNSGQDVIYNLDEDVQGINGDTIEIATGIAVNDINLSRLADSLMISIKGHDDTLQVGGYFSNDGASSYAVENIKFSEGTVLDVAAVKSKISLTQKTTGDDTIYGYSGDESLSGSAGNDIIYGYAGNDTLSGEQGNDILWGGDGADAYIFGKNSGQDTINNQDNDASGSRIDTIQLSSEVTAADLVVRRSGDHLLIRLKGTIDSLQVVNHFSNDGATNMAVDQIRFFDGTIWNADSIKIKALAAAAGNDMIEGYASADLLKGGEGLDSLYGGNGNDTLDGGAGNDILAGSYGDGDDVYIFGKGYGQDIVKEYSGSGTDTIQFAAGITQADVSMFGSQGNMLIQINGTNDSLMVKGYFNSDLTPNYVVEDIKFADGSRWIPTVTFLANPSGDASSQFIKGTFGDNKVYGYGGNDTLDGGVGDDMLDGGAGNDTYLYGRGYGRDTINAYDVDVGKFDVIKFDASILVGDINLQRYSDDLYFSIKDDIADSLQIRNYFTNDSNGGYQVEQIKFADGTAWDANFVKAKMLLATKNNDSLIGYSSDDSIAGLEGDDTLLGNLGNDTLNGHNGRDGLLGGGGNDYLYGEAGDDGLTGGDGNDFLEGGRGDDVLNGSAGSDTFFFEKGFGNDEIFGADTAIENLDVIQFGTSVLSTDVKVSSDGSTLFLSLKGTNDKISILNFFKNDALDGSSIDQVKFSDSTTWDVDAIKKMTLIATPGDDNLHGYATADVLDGDSGNDFLHGNGGSDIYRFGRASGNDTILSYDVATNKNDIIDFGEGISPNDILVRRSAGDLKLAILGTPDTLSVPHYFVNYLTGGHPIDTIKFRDGTIWNFSFIESMVNAPSANNDSLWGNVAGDVIFGLSGDDDLSGNGGNDKIDGGMGNDKLWGAIANDTLIGGSGNDSLYGQGGQNIIDGGAGDDFMHDGGYDKNIFLIRKGSGSDSIQATYGVTTTIIRFVDIPSTEVASMIFNGYDFKVDYGSGNINFNYFAAYNGNDMRFEFSDGVIWDRAVFNAWPLLNRIQGSGILTGTSLPDKINGGAANDTLNAAEGNDFLFAGQGNDSLDGGGGNDWLYGEAGIDTLLGGTGNDTLNGGLGDDSMTGGDGNDTYHVNFYFDVEAEIVYQDKVVETDSATSGIDTAITSSHLYTLAKNVENLVIQANGTNLATNYGNALNNTITGSDETNYIYGKDGNDTIHGGKGNDGLYGDAGNDSLDGGEGNDGLYGGLGTDTLNGGDGNDTYYVTNYWDDNGDLQRDQIIEGDSAASGIDIAFTADNDYYLARNVENLQVMDGVLAHGNALGNRITGSDFADFLEALGGNDTILSGAGNDIIWAGDGADSIEGGVGNDTILSDSNLNGSGPVFNGNDTINGGLGDDTLTDNSTSSNDVYIWGRGQGVDTLTDSGGSDRLDVLSGVSANQMWLRKVGSNLELSVIGTSDKFTVNNWYASATNQVESIKLSDGKTLTANKVDTLVNAMAAFTPPAAGQTTLPANYQTALNPVIDANWA